MTKQSKQLSSLLEKVESGESDSTEELFHAVYQELHRLATRYMRFERKDHTLQPTALINEAFLVMTQRVRSNSDAEARAEPTSNRQDVRETVEIFNQFKSLDHFIATAAVVMRHILVNHAKSKQAGKRGGDWRRISSYEVTEEFERRSIDLIALDEALEKLRKIDPVQYRLVELRFFGGMTFRQCARVLDISERAAYYEWAHARAWLREQLER